MGYTYRQRQDFMDWLAEADQEYRITSLVIIEALMTFFISLQREEES